MRLSEKGLNLIKKFEGVRLTSYKCSANVDTIGYGHTGPDVYPGLKITEAEAEDLLLKDVESFQQCVSSFVTTRVNQNEYDALVSFTFNVGTTAFINSTLLKLLNGNADRKIVAAEFGRWVKAGGDEPVEGLVRRRAAEKKLFLEKIKHPLLKKSILAKKDTYLKARPVDSSTLVAEDKLFVPKGSAWEWTEICMYAGKQHQRVFLEAQPEREWWIWPDHWKIINDVEETENPSKSEIKLKVPYYSQRDNYRDASRTCFSSSCAMLLSGIHPTVIEDDGEYIQEVFEIGDTTEAWVQIEALKHFGVKAKFVQNAGWDTLEEQLKKGSPVPMGILHKGPVSAPTGGGHWICCVGMTADRSKLWIHDPWGELDLIGGTYISMDGEYKLYSKKNLGPRWLVEGGNSGWAILAT
jgi:GH24 family phage-related lysozyme (muramidase)